MSVLRETDEAVMVPADHARLLVELMRPAGADQARRLVAALLLAPHGRREAAVRAFERRMVEEHGGPRRTRTRTRKDSGGA